MSGLMPGPMNRRGLPPGAAPRGALLGAAAALLAVLPLTGGCRPGKPATAPVRGRILLDGRPLAEAAVLFEPEGGGVPSRGSTAADGSFTLSTFARGDGALVGRHRVAVTKVVIEGVRADQHGLETSLEGPPSRLRSLIPARYADPAASGLTADVPAGGARPEFSLAGSD